MMTDTPADLAACDELEAVVERMTPAKWYVVEPPWRQRGGGTYVVAGSNDPHVGKPVVDGIEIMEWPADADPDYSQSDADLYGIVALRNKAVPLIRQLRQMLAAAEGAVSDWHCKACNTVFPDWGDKMRCSCGKGERWPSSFNQRLAERERDAAVKNANECLIAVRDSYLAMNEAKVDAAKLREENGRLRAAAQWVCSMATPSSDLPGRYIVHGADMNGLRESLAATPGKADDTPAKAD